MNSGFLKICSDNLEVALGLRNLVRHRGNTIAHMAMTELDRY
jgi:hypothetical protein